MTQMILPMIPKGATEINNFCQRVSWRNTLDIFYGDISDLFP